ncbi:hypothetical protein PMAYCL1PPCAC_09973, partial [Pristionchus mayeri]
LLLVMLSSVGEAACPDGLPAADVKGILESHNRLRNNISKGTYIAKGKKMPAAKKTIPALKWDCALEKSAQNVSKQCIYEHSTNRHDIGENLWRNTGSSPFKNIAGFGRMASNSWKNEFQEYGWPSTVFTYEIAVTGELFHATQMAWAETKTIGCGITLCKGATQVIVVCHYNKTGNWLGAPIYVPK